MDIHDVCHHGMMLRLYLLVRKAVTENWKHSTSAVFLSFSSPSYLSTVYLPVADNPGHHYFRPAVRGDLIVSVASSVCYSPQLCCHGTDWLTEHGFTSAPTQYRLYSRRFLQVLWPNQQCQSTEGGWLVIQTGLNLTMLTSPCYNGTVHVELSAGTAT